jgi:hypothetical protein
MDSLSGFAERQIPHAPGIGQKRRGNAEAHHIGERIEFLAELAIRAESARNASIEGIEQNREANGARRVVEIRDAAFEGGQDGVIAAEKISDGKGAGQEIRPALRGFLPGAPSIVGI